jgi:hypothetical protein
MTNDGGPAFPAPEYTFSQGMSLIRPGSCGCRRHREYLFVLSGLTQKT